MRLKRIVRWAVGTLTFLVALVFLWYQFFLDWDGKPFCHKQVWGVLINWSQANGTEINSVANPFPNVHGRSNESLDTIRDLLGVEIDWTKDYRYVPGLKQDDPGDLVLMYFDRPTRWITHVVPSSLLTEKAWMIVPVDFTMSGRPLSGQGEMNERVSLDEFRTRLRRTLDFVRKNKRPNWQTVVAEHTAFLDALERTDR